MLLLNVGDSVHYFQNAPIATPTSWPDHLKCACYGPVSVCVHVCTVKMNDYKQPFFSYLSYIIVTQVTLKIGLFLLIHFCSKLLIHYHPPNKHQSGEAE